MPVFKKVSNGSGVDTDVGEPGKVSVRHSFSLIKSNKLRFLIVILLVCGAAYYVFVYLGDKTSKKQDQAPNNEQVSALDNTINEFKSKAKTPEEHMALATLYDNKGEYKKEVEEIELAYQQDKQDLSLVQQSKVIAQHLPGEYRDRLDRNIKIILSSKTISSYASVYSMAVSIEGVDKASSKLLYKLVLDNYDKAIFGPESTVTSDLIRKKIDEL